MLLSRKMIKGVIMSTGKMKVLVVSGFLGAGKTTWIKMLIDHNPCLLYTSDAADE